MNEIENVITKETSACFEPALDYIVLKFPRWDLQKFTQVSAQLGSEMKSVGEVMAIGRKFEEVLQKAIRMLDIGLNGFSGNNFIVEDLKKAVSVPSDKRIFYLYQALKSGISVEELNELTKIDKWFLYKMKNIVELEETLKSKELKELDTELLKEAKQNGFSDEQIAKLTGANERDVRKIREHAEIIPFVKQIDTLAAEYPAQTNYLYLTYNAEQDDIEMGEQDQIIVLGGGAYRIGSSVEFDWCCVNSVQTLNKLNYKTIMINFNPETVRQITIFAINYILRKFHLKE